MRNANDVSVEVVGGVRRARSDIHERYRKRAGDKTRKSVQTRKKIMAMATEIMVERGNTSFQMSEVSRGCNMSKGALYYYFADKEDLIQAIFDDALDDLVKAIDKTIADAASAEEALMFVCSEYASRVREGSPLSLALMHELIRSREYADEAGVMRLQYIVRVIADLLEQGKEEGVVRQEIDANLTAIAVCGAFAFAAAGINEEGLSTDAFASQLFRIIVGGIGRTQ
ncbi:MAG: TetR/AcrR family transcriptional regulator [Coriobacteriales bacterium]|nr:TetR/AcrR family transcriptional regulator [Coriobacteriales bacterium]